MTRLNCCKEETLRTIFWDGVSMAFGQRTLLRKAGALTIVIGVSLCMVPIMGFAWFAGKLDGGK